MFSESALAEKLIFQDSIGHWAEDAILKLTEEGVISDSPMAFATQTK
ncbi:hypothetical protein SDC9_170534 [bioreactor metagenome]|uniref:Uncharacterized protein n=2 Tax=root TaxID=1 RepID=A0A645G8B0_9ZZZZ